MKWAVTSPRVALVNEELCRASQGKEKLIGCVVENVSMKVRLFEYVKMSSTRALRCGSFGNWKSRNCP
jgi:hypothetical protein